MRERPGTLLLATLTLLIIADATTTHYGIQAGLVETNPAARPLFTTHGPTRAIQTITTAKLIIIFTLDKATAHIPYQNTWRALAYGTLTLIHTLTVASNLLLIL